MVPGSRRERHYRVLTTAHQLAREVRDNVNMPEGFQLTGGKHVTDIWYYLGILDELVVQYATCALETWKVKGRGRPLLVLVLTKY